MFTQLCSYVLYSDTLLINISIKNIASKNKQHKKEPDLVYFEQNWVQLLRINSVLQAFFRLELECRMFLASECYVSLCLYYSKKN